MSLLYQQNKNYLCLEQTSEMRILVIWNEAAREQLILV
jgi:hypothetical protein